PPPVGRTHPPPPPGASGRPADGSRPSAGPPGWPAAPAPTSWRWAVPPPAEARRSPARPRRRPAAATPAPMPRTALAPPPRRGQEATDASASRCDGQLACHPGMGLAVEVVDTRRVERQRLRLAGLQDPGIPGAALVAPRVREGPVVGHGDGSAC